MRPSPRSTRRSTAPRKSARPADRRSAGEGRAVAPGPSVHQEGLHSTGEGDEDAMSLLGRVVAGGLAVVVVVALAWLVAGPARGAREDIGAQRTLVARQLATIRSQLALQQQQLDLQKQQLAVARRTGRQVEEILALTRATHTVAVRQLTLSRMLTD